MNSCWSRVIRWGILVACSLFGSSYLYADVLLSGNYTIGDNTNTALSPTVMVGKGGGTQSLFYPINPIHFKLTSALQVSQISLDGISGLEAGASFVIWNSNGTAVVDQVASSSSPDRLSGSWLLPAGDYQMAVWGQCYKRNGTLQGRYVANCADWDDFSFSGIRLVSTGTTNAFHFIQRQHIGDSTDAERWYPPAPSSTYVVYPFTVQQRSVLDSLTMYRLHEWSITNGTRMYIRTAGSSYTPLIYYFTANGNITWPIDYEIAAGEYELIVESVSRGSQDRDDISWDDIILSVTPIAISPEQLCAEVFPYPVQARSTDGSIDFCGNQDYVCGRVFGTDGGKIGYRQPSQVLGLANSGNCDNGVCRLDGLGGSMSVPSSRFPLASAGTSINLGYNQKKTVTAADGTQFNQVVTSQMASIDFQSAGLTIKSMSLGSGRGGNPYTVRFSPGEYWIETLNMDFDTSIEVTGPVTLYIKKLKMNSGSFINSPGSQQAGDTSKVLAVIYDSMQLDNGSTFSGLVYQADVASGSINLTSSSYIKGRVNAKTITFNYGSSIDAGNDLCSLPTPASVDHYELSYPASALTCSPASVQLKACKDGACTSLYTESVSVSLAPSSGWSSNPLTFTGGLASLSLSHFTAGSVNVGISSAAPAASNALRCYSGGQLDATCTLSFADSGFIFDVPDIIANKAATNVVVKAVKKDDSTKQCVPGFASTSKTLNFWSDYIDPVAAGRPESRHVSVNGSAIGRTSAEATPLTLVFDAQGQATLSSVNYTDAGQMQLNARYTGSAGAGDAGLVMSGSDQFVSRPVGLCIQPESVCAAGNSSCPYFRRAGESFSVRLTAQAWESDSDSDLCAGNQTTPNFALSGIALGSTLVAPTGGVSATVGTASYNHVASSSAQQTVSQSLSEVGVFRLTATPPSYLGTTIPSSSSAPVGRITPYDFALTNPSITAGCGSFSYMGQPMPTSFTVTARNSSGGTTRNYRDEFARGLVSLVAENGDNGVPLSSRLGGLGSLGWQAGLFTANQHPETFARNTPPDGPFSQLAIGVSVDDQDDIPLLNRNMDVLSSGSCGSSCSAVRLSTQDLRHGRLSVSSGRAAIDSALALPLIMESYTGSGWQRNVDDACTQFDLKVSKGFVFDRTYDAAKAQLTLNDNSSTSLLALTTSRDMPTGQPTSATAQAGYIWLHFTAPGISDRVNYQLDLNKQPKQPTWLSFDWNGNGLVEVENDEGLVEVEVEDMSGWAFFNQWRSSDRVIYRREVLN